MNAIPHASRSSIVQRLLLTWIEVEAGELTGLLAAFGCAFTMFAAYSLLRPIRDTMGISSGVASLPLLFWATFLGMLIVQPLYGWIVSRYRRALALPWIYAFFAGTLLAFYAWFVLQPDHTWVARAYFVWVSVLNLFVVAVFWSLMADVFSREQAGRFFGFIAGGLSLGGLAGPSLAGWLAGPLGTLNLLLISAALLLVAAALMRRITRWQTLRAKVGADVVDVDVALRGSAWGGFAQVASSPYLIGIALFVLMSCAVNTIMYVEQGRAVAAAIATPDLRTALFGKIDFGVQATALLIQLFLFGRLLRRFGFCVMLGSIPLLMILAFATVGLSSSLQVVLGAIVARRVGEYAVTKPCRDMLFTVVSREQKYKAKSLLDTFVYRGADALAASAYAGVVALASTAGTAAGLAGIAVASIWLTVSIWLARRFSAASGERRPGAVPAAVEPPAESRALHLPPELRCTTVSLPHLGDRHDDDHRLQLSLHQGRADSSSCGEHRVVLDSIK